MDSRPKHLGTALENRYRVDALLARGGMSVVYRGLDTRLDRPVAIKIMDAHYAGDRSFLDRFELEARAAARLHDPGVVAVYDQGIHHGPEGDLVYLAMELVEGGTLRDLIRERGALPPELALSVLEPMLSALATAHRHGMVHRDIKPENVLIGEGGAVKVADFGLVRAAAASSNTSGSVILGTVAYLSPEQVTTGAADARSDVYAAGVVLYEMLTGTPPYSGDTALSVAYRHVNDDVPPPGDARPDLPSAIDDLVLRATRRDPQGRPNDAAAFLAEVHQVGAALNFRRTTVPVPVTEQPTTVTPAVAADGHPADPANPVPSGEPSTDRMGPDAHAARANAAAVHPDEPSSDSNGPRGTRALTRSDVLSGTEPHHAPSVPSGARRPLPPDPRKRRTRLVVLWTIVVLVLAALVGTFSWWMGSGRFTDVPRLSGLNEQVASQTLQDADLVPAVTRQISDTVPAGTVIGSDPTAGTQAMRGDRITVMISTGKPRVPAVRPGSSVEDAERALGAAQLRPRFDDSANQYSGEIPKGKVIGVQPSTGTPVNSGSQVTLIVSKGPPPVPVPNLEGMSKDAAFARLTSMGLHPYVAGEQFSGQVDSGHVVTTNPPAGTDVVPTDQPRIGVIVSNAISVPKLLGHTVEETRQKLTELGLSVRVQQFFPMPQSRVVKLSPSPGQSVPKGTTVTVTAVP